MGQYREANGGLTEEEIANPSVCDIGAERWAKAEKATQSILRKVQPTAASEQRRRAVIDYVQSLIGPTSLACEVFPYGSVPLRTYLPDGDIDLTAFGGATFEDALANNMVSILEAEDQNKAAEFIVKDVQLIRAEVKLVKCIVQNIVVDISFNQIGGLCTLCFLEQVDRLIGKDHLFKRSIILIKTWCYYESRILGAHHGLISTYALETLVLYIFHFFHATLDGPLAVLYKFLDYFSKFDWENYCVSLTGPVRLSSLPESVVEMPENDGGALLLSNDFIRYCLDTFSVPSKSDDLNSRTFLQKHLNIIDPLKENNNLGRSVSKGNFFRIRSAFNYGARKLGSILLQSEDDVAEELRNFFPNTLDRHGNGERPDVQDPSNGYCSAFPAPDIEPSQVEEQADSELKSASDSKRHGMCSLNPDGSLCEEDGHKGITGADYMLPLSADRHGKEGLLGYRLSGDAADLASSIENAISISPVFTDSSKCQPTGQGMPYHAPHLFFTPNSLVCNGETETESSQKHAVKQTVKDIKEVSSAPKVYGCSEGYQHFNSTNSAGVSMKNLSDLSGDYNNYFNYMQYGRWCYDYASTMPAVPVLPPPPSPFHMTYSWEASQQPSYLKRNGLSHGSTNGVIPSQAIYTINPMLMPGMHYALEEILKPRGTGTYFPNLNRPPQGYRPSLVKGRHQPGWRSPRNNGRDVTFSEMHTLERNVHELPLSEFSADQSDDPLSSLGHHSMTGLALQSEGVVEFGSVGLMPLGTSISETTMQQKLVSSSPTQQSSPVSPITGMQRTSTVFCKDLDRVPVEPSSYHLRDEDDFPPLSF